MARKNAKKFYESPIWDFIELAGNVVALNLLFFVSCLPIITIGPACCGLYSAIRFYARKDSWFKGFKEGFKTNVWRMMIICTVGIAVILFVGNDILAIIKNYRPEFLTSLIPQSIIVLFLMTFLLSVIVYNVYFPRKMFDLLIESASFTFKAFFILLLPAVLFWIPLVAAIAFLSEFLPFLLVFLSVYFSLIAFFSTIMLKNKLITILNEKRASGELPQREDEEEEIE